MLQVAGRQNRRISAISGIAVRQRRAHLPQTVAQRATERHAQRDEVDDLNDFGSCTGVA